MTDAATTLALLAARDPAALPLARLASLAARVEPELLRALRLALVPAATAGTEAALWFSGAVHARGPRAITLDPTVALQLRADLLADPRDRIARALRIVRRLHRNAPALLRLEERLIVWSLRGRTARIDAALAPVVSALVGDPDRAEDLAAWAQRALPRLPAAARDAGAYWALLFVANLRLPATAFDAPPTAAAVAAAVPAIFANVVDLHVAVERRGDTVRLRLADAAGPGTIPAPAVRPVVVVVTSSGHPPVARLAELDRWCDDVAVAGSTVRLRVADGREHVATTIAGPGAALRQPAIADACVQLLSGDRPFRSGYLISDRLIATDQAGAREANIAALIGGIRHAIERVHATTDVRLCIARLASPIAGIEPLALADRPLAPDAAWQIAGLDRSGAPLSLSGVGTHRDERGLQYLSIDLASVPLAALTGAPVVVDGQVVAQIWGANEDGVLVIGVAPLIALVRDLARAPRTDADPLANLAAPIGRSIYAAAVSAQIARDATSAAVQVTHLIGGTGHQRSKLVRDVVTALGGDVVYARTFAWGDALPDDLEPLADRPGVVVIDRLDALDRDAQGRLQSMMMRSIASRGARWIITGATPLDEFAGGPIRRVLGDALPRDPALRVPLQTFATLPDTLGAWGADVLVELLTTATAMAIELDRSGGLDVTHRIVLDAARAWLACPCEHHARIETPTTVPLVDSIIRAVRAAQDGDAAQLSMHASLGLGAAMMSGFEPEHLHLRLPMFGGDEVRRAEAAASGLVSAVIELDGERPFTPRVDRTLETMRRLAHDGALDLFLADRDVEPGTSPRLLVETTRAGYDALLTARRAGLLQRVLERPVRWIAEPNPPPDLEDPNRGHFGGLPDSNSLSLRATIGALEDRNHEVEIMVELTDQPTDAVEILDDRGVVATLQTTPGGAHSVIQKKWRSFTIGVRSGTERAELDLRTIPGGPEAFVHPPHVWSAIPLEPGTTWQYQGSTFNTQVMHAASGESRMTVVDALEVDHERPIEIALMDGSYLSTSGTWILVRFGSHYYRLAGDAEDFARLRAAPETVEPLLWQSPDLLFRFPIAKGEPVVSGTDPATGWRCANVHRREDGTRTYDFVRDDATRGPTTLTVTEGIGITAFGDHDDKGSETQISLTRWGRDEANPPPTAEPVARPDVLARLFTPIGRSVFAVDADAMLIQAVQAPGARVVQLVGGTGHQRSGLVRRLAEGFVDDVRFARTFAWDEAFPDELDALAGQACFVVLDRANAMDARAIRRLKELIARTIVQPGAQWIITAAEPIADLAGSLTRTLAVDDLPRDRAIRQALPAMIRGPQPVATRDLLAWGIDTLLAVVLEVSMPLNALEPIDTWLRCPCAHHGAAREARGREGVTRRLVELAQAQDLDRLARHADELLAGFRADDRTAAMMMRAVLGNDTARYVEAQLGDRAIAWIELDGERPFVAPLEGFATWLREATGDAALEVFHSDRNTERGEQPRVVVELTRAGYEKMLAAFQQRRLVSVEGRRILSMATPGPTEVVADTAPPVTERKR